MLTTTLLISVFILCCCLTAATSMTRMHLSQLQKRIQVRGAGGSAFTVPMHDEPITSWEWDATTCTDPVGAFAEMIPDGVEGLSDKHAFAQALIAEVQNAYLTVPYHNFQHGMMVSQAYYVLLTNTKDSAASRSLRTPKKMLAGILAALCHDLGHPGIGEAALKNVKDGVPQSIFQGEKRSEEDAAHLRAAVQVVESQLGKFKAFVEDGLPSPMERFHLGECKRIVNEISAGLFSDEDWSLIEDMIQGTDMTAHGNHIQTFAKADESKAISEHQLAVILLKTADIGHALHEWDISCVQQIRFSTEFWSQMLMMPTSKDFGRATTWGSNQFFLEKLLKPLLDAVSPQLSTDMAKTLADNYEDICAGLKEDRECFLMDRKAPSQAVCNCYDFEGCGAAFPYRQVSTPLAGTVPTASGESSIRSYPSFRRS